MSNKLKLMDAQAAMGFVLPQTTHIERQVNEIVYPDIQYPSLVPVDSSAPEWVKSVTFFSADKFGAAKWINGNADDIPRAGTERTKFETAVHMAGIGYGWGLEEISQAALLGMPLTADDAIAARRAYEEFVDEVALFGNAEKGLQGLVNNSTVPAASAITGNWQNGTTTPAQILADVNGALVGQYAATLFTSMADTLLLPYERFLYLGSTMVSANSDMSILRWLQENNAYTTATGRPLLIRGMRRLLTAGAGDTARMIAYRRDPMVVKLHIPMPHRFLPVYQSGPMRWDVPGVFRLGGVDIRRPKEFSYVDGI